MSSKSDRDNRSNQMNPNNDAYYSSRGGGCDDDDEVNRRVGVETHMRRDDTPSEPLGDGPRTETFAFAAVSMERKVTYRTAIFEAPGAWIGRNAATIQLEDFLIDFEPLAKWRLIQYLAPSEIALFAVFDPTKSCLPWHLPFNPKDPLITRQWISVEHLDRLDIVSLRLRPMPEPYFKVWPFDGADRIERERKELAASKLHPAPFVEALRNAVSLDAPSWGAFNVPRRGRLLMSDVASVRSQLSNC